MEKVKFNCKKCGIEGETMALTTKIGKVLLAMKLCDLCADKQEAENKVNEEASRQNRREESWLKICPPLYNSTDINHPNMDKDMLKHVMAWRDLRDGIGVGIFGETGRCKTRMMFLLLKRLHFQGVQVEAIGAKRLGTCVSRSFGDGPEAHEARSIIARCRSTRVLFLDDVGKDKLTDRTEAEFYDLIEHRTSHMLPTMWTANASGEQLRAMLGEDRGVAILRRMREFSIPIEV